MGALNFEITADDRQFQEKIQSVGRQVQSTARAIEGSGLSVEQAFSGMSRAAASFGAAFSAQQFAQKVLQVRGQFQQIEMAFETMLGSAEKSNALMAQMVDTAARTPFDLDGVANGAKQLLAYGLASDQVNDTLVRLGDIAAGLSIPLGDIVYLYGTTMAQGRLYTQDLNQFTGRGIPMIGELAKQFGVAESKVKDLVSEGKVGFPEVQKVIESLTNEGGKFGGLMAKQSATITGQIANLEDSIDMMFNEVGENVQDFATSSIEGVNFLVEHYKSFGSVLLSIATAWGINKAAQMAYIAAARSGYDEEIAKLQQELGLLDERQTKLDADIESGVSSGTLTSEKAEQLQALREQRIQMAEEEVKVAKTLYDAQGTEIGLTNEKIASVQDYIEAKQDEISEINDAVAEAMNLGDAEEYETQLSRLATAENELNTASEELNTLEKTKNTLVTQRKATAEQITTAQQNLHTASTQRNTVAQQANTVGARLATIATGAYTAAVRGATAAMNALKAAFATNPFGMVATAVSLAVGAFLAFKSEEEETISVTDRMTQSMENARSKADALYSIIDNVSAASKAYNDAQEDLVKLAEDYGFKIDDEKNKTEQLNAIKEKLVGLLKEEAYYKQQASMNQAYEESIAAMTKQSMEDLKDGLEDLDIEGGKAEAFKIAWSNSITEVGEAMAKMGKDVDGTLRGYYEKDASGQWVQTVVHDVTDAQGRVISSTKEVTKANEKQIAQLDLIDQMARTSGKTFEEVYQAVGRTVNDNASKIADFRYAQGEANAEAGKLAPKFDAAALSAKLAKNSASDLKKEIQNIMASYASNDIRFKVSFDVDDVPSWMKTMDVSRLKQMAAWYTSNVAANKKAGRVGTRVNGKYMSNAAMAQRAASYATAAEQKQAEADKAATEKKKKESSKKDNSAEREAEAKANRLEAIRKYAEEVKEQVADAEQDISDRRLEALDESFEKEKAKIDESYNKLIAENQRREKEWIEALAEKKTNEWLNANPKATKQQENDHRNSLAKSLRRSDLSAEQQRALQGYEDIAATERAKSRQELVTKYTADYAGSDRERKEQIKKLKTDIAAIEAALAECEQKGDAANAATLRTALAEANRQRAWVTEAKDAWNAYFQEYGTFLERRRSLQEQFEHETAGMDTSSPEYLTKRRRFEEDLSTLTLETFKKEMDWDNIFGDLSRLSKAALDTLATQIETLIKKEKTLSVKAVDELRAALEKVRQEQTSKGNTIAAAAGISKLRAARHAKDAANKEVNEADGGELIAQYRAAETTEEREKVRGKKVTDPTDGSLTTFGKLLDRAADAVKRFMQAQDGASRSIQSAGKGLSQIAQLGNSVGDLLGQFGVDLPEGFSTAFSGLGQMGNAMEAFDVTKPGSLLNITNYVKFASGLTSVFTGIADGLAELFGGNDSIKDYEDAAEELEKMSSLWDTLIAKKKEYAELSFGDTKKGLLADAVTAAEANLKALQDTAEKYGKAHTWNAHSHAYRSDRAIGSDTFAQMSQVLGRNITSVQDLLNLTNDELVKLMEVGGGDWWTKLDDTQRDYIQQIADANDEIQDLNDSIAATAQGITFDDMVQSFGDAMRDMSKTYDDFVDEITDKMRDAVIDAALDGAEDEIKKIYQKYNDLAEKQGGKLTAEQVARRQEEIEELARKYYDKREQAVEAYGLDESTTEENQKNSYATASEDSIEELNGRMLANNEALYSIRAFMVENQEFEQTKLNTLGELVANGTTQLLALVGGQTAQAALVTEMRDIQLQSLSCLQTIEGKSKRLDTINDTLLEIKKKVKEI